VRANTSAQTGIRERGQSLAEFAIILPLLFLLLLGIIEFGRLFNAWVTVQHGAREAARYAVTGRSDRVQDDRLASIQDMALTQTRSLPSDPTVSVRSRPSASVPNWAGGPGGPCDQVEVRVDYTFDFLFPIFGLAPQLDLDATERLVAEPFGDCDQ
jgi:hypothetical protein